MKAFTTVLAGTFNSSRVIKIFGGGAELIVDRPGKEDFVFFYFST